MSAAPTAVAAAAFVPWAAWWGAHAALTLAGLLPPRRPSAGARVLDVVVPAHDEESTIATLLASLRDQGPQLGRVVVVADHCTDGTAELARRFDGVDVLDRRDGPPGKPPAIAAGVAHLATDRAASDGVIVLDADCTCAPGFVAALAARLGRDDDVVQAAYTIEEARGDAVRGGLRRAFALRNVVRPAGADRLGLPVLLTGSGIALRWSALDRLSFGNSQVGFTGNQPAGADLLMGLELLAGGVHARFASGAVVTAPAPPDDAALATQHLRWEGGQAVNWSRAARVAGRLLRRGDVRGLLGLVDWMAPPLAPTTAAYVVVAGVVAGGVVAGLLDAPALAAAAVPGLLLATYLLVGVTRLEGPAAAVDLVLSAPRFLGWKLGLYQRFRRREPVGSTGA